MTYKTTANQTKPGYNQAWFFIGFQRGAGRFYLNPTLAGHPARTEVSFWLATDNGPLQVFLARKSPWRLFLPIRFPALSIF